MNYWSNSNRFSDPSICPVDKNEYQIIPIHIWKLQLGSRSIDSRAMTEKNNPVDVPKARCIDGIRPVKAS